ncbi:type VII secretion system-associated protein [Streptomyces sp. ASQP_92]|uniref:type VII secretion system-associated protein n=1 Tax=Streptomyces sp. ASQP_92 TaxID=2979116 RepID=UPI0021C12982|nr:type VII secretion system-associated protein [Streptomyces sp. ASQP_92]MCT9089269.1 type VII secretion system-associated protein [Streptomyces sp. ASQP_92]
MTETMMGSRGDVVAARGDEFVRCDLAWGLDERSRTPYRVRAAGPWGNVSGAAEDLFSALLDVRLQLEASGWRLLVKGARPDVWQSGMLRSSGSTRAYRLRAGVAPTPEDTVDLFEDAADRDVVSVAEHKAAYAEWLDSFEARREGAPEPVMTPELRAQAKGAPNSWLYSIDAAYDPRGSVPPYAVIGAWPVDGRGEPGDFKRNPNYRPSPVAMGLPVPTDAIEAAMQLAATGHGPEADVVRRLVGATVFLVPTDEAGVALYADAEGRFVPVLTDPKHAPSAAPQLQAVSCGELVASLPADVALKLNPGSRISVRIPSAELRAAML